MSELGAILLAGGRGTRVDGEIKPLFQVGGTTLLERAVRASTDAGARPITVVAPVLDPKLPVDWVREHPPFGGPAAAAVAALSAWAEAGTRPTWTLLLACDLPRADRAVAALMAAVPLLPADGDGVCLGGATGRPQWLTGLYRTAALEDAASRLPDAGRDAAVRALVDDLAITVIADVDGGTVDVDTWQDLERARAEEDAP
ncbi:hypothetical protein GCM10022200_29180 [Microbacterium awajiense]|uniref:MobA-like NTP transferase domain-containing protein n=1 Tax=Microbacterium awajiense TaxID=415214 RepID=A0ABP7AZF7_9MICO